MSKNWMSLFQHHILERGFAYFCDEAVENLKISETMQRIKGGKEVVKTILACWREAYKRRTAMWDEFSRKKL